MSSSSLLLIDDLNSDHQNGDGQSIAPINLTRRVSRLYRLYDRIIFRKRWAKLAKKLIVKFEIRVTNKLHKLNCGYATLISNRKKMIFERWKRRFYFIKLSRKLVHNYRIFEITESLNDLKSEYSEHYRQIWGNWSKILLKENKKIQIIQTLHNKNLLAKYFNIWEDNFEFYYYELRELQNKWRSLAYGILARETISNARQIKWQFICDKLRVKKMKDYYTKERFRKIWIHLTKRIYAKDKSEKFLLGRRTIELNKKWLFMVKGMRNIEFSKAFERSKLPSLFKKYICLRKTHKLNHLSEKLIATKKLFHDQMITKKYFSVWFKRFNLIINSKLIANITQNFAIDTYMQSIANSSARTIQKLCRFYLMKKTFRQNLRMCKFFEIWHFKTFIFPELYPKIRVPKLTMNIQFHINFDFPFVYYAPRFDFIRNVFDYKQILKLDRANKISKKAINQINVSTDVLGVEQIITSLGIYDFIRPQYHPDYSKRKISFHPDFDFKKPLIYISKKACPIPVSKRTSPKKDIPKKKVKTTVIKKFRFRLLLKYQNLDVFSNFHYQNSHFSRINQNLVYDNLLSFESPKLNVESIINYNLISMPSQRLLFRYYYKMHLEKLNFSEYQQYIFDKFSLNFNFGYQKRVERRSMLCSRRIRPRLFFKDINVNRKTFQFLLNFSSTLNPIFNNLPVKFTNLTIPTEIVSSLKRRKNAHIPEKIDYGIKRKNTQINNTAKILLNHNFQFKYSFVNFSTFSNYKKHFVAERNINIIPQFDFNKPLLFLSKSKPRCCQKLTKIVHNVDDDLYIPYLDNWKYIIQYISNSSLSFSMVATFSKSIFIDALIPNKEINQPSKIKTYHQVTPTIKNQPINFYLYEMDLKIHQFDVCVNSFKISNLVRIYQSPKPRIFLPSNIMTNINLHVPFFERKKLNYIRNTNPVYKIPQIQMNLTFDFFQNIIYKSCTYIQNHVYYSTFMNKKDLHIFFNANPIEIYNYSPEICIKGFMNYQMSVEKSHEKVVNFNLLHDIINFNFNQIDLNLQVEYLKNLSPINKINKCGNVKFTKYRSPTLHLEIPIMRSLKSRTFQLNTYYYEKSDIIQNKELINNFIYDISINMNKNIFFGHQPDCFLNNYQKDASEIKLELKYDIDFEFNNLINNFLLILKLDSLNDSREIITSTEKNINNVKNRNSNISETTMFHLISHKNNLIPFLPDINTNILQNYSCIKVIPKVESTFLSNISINFFSYLQSTVEIYRNHVIPFKRYFYLNLKNDDDVVNYDVLNDIQMIDVNYQFLDQLPNILFLKSFYKPPQNHNIDELITFQYVSDVSLINSISSFQSIVNQKLLKMQAYVQKNLSGTDSDYDARFIENKEAGLNNFPTTSLIKPIQGMLMNKFYHRVSLFENIELNGFILQKEINNSMSNQMNLFHLFNEILSLKVNNFDLLEIGNFTMKLNFLVNNFDGIKHKTQIKTDDIHIFIPPLNFNDIVGSLNINQLSRYYKSCILDFENHEKFEFSLEKINIQSLNIAPLKYLKMKDISNFAISLLFDNIDLFAKFREYATIDFDFPLLSTLLFDSTDESETCISKLLDDSLACMLRNIAVDIDLIPNYFQENQSTIHKTICSVDEIINKSLTKSLIDGLKFESIFSNAIINYYSPFVDYDVHIYIDIVELETIIKSLLHYSQIFLSEKRNIVIHNHFSCFEEIIKIDEKLTNPESYIQCMQNYKAAYFPFNHTFNMDKSFSFPSINEAAMTLSEILINMLYQINNMEFQNYFVSEKKIVLQKSLQLFENDFINILQGRFIGTLYSTIDLYSSQSSTIDFPQFQPKEREQTNINQFPLSIPYRFPQKRYSNFIEDTLHSLFRTTLQNSQELSLFVTSYYISTDEDDEEKVINIVDNERDFLLENAEGIFQESLQTSFSYPGLPSLQLFDFYCSSNEISEEILFAVIDSLSSQLSVSLENSLMASYNANIGDIFNYLFNDNVNVLNGVSECMPIIESTISNALLNALFYTKRPSVEPIFEIRQIWSTQSVNSDYMLDNLNFSVSFSLDNLYKNDSYKWLDNYQMSFVMEFSHNQNQLFDLTFEYNRLFEPQLSTLMIFQISSHFFSENNFQVSKYMSQNVCESFENNIIPNNILKYLVNYISKQFCEFDLLDNLYQQKLIEKPYLTIQLRKTLSTLFRLKTVLLPVYIPQNIHSKLLLFDQKCNYLSYIQSGVLYKIFTMNYRDDSYVRRYIIPRTVKMIENDFQNVLQYCLHSALHSPEISFDLPSLHNPPPEMVQIEPYQFPQKRCNNFLNKALTGILMSAIIHPQDLSLINSFDFIKSEGEGSKIYSEKLIFPGNTNTEKHLINENFYHHETEQIILNCLQTSFSISPYSSMNIFIEEQVINLDERNGITTLPLDKEDPPSRYIDIHFFTDDFSNTLNSTLRNSLFSSLQLSCITAANSLLGLDYEEPDQEMSVITGDYDLTNIYDCNVFYFMNDPAHKMISDFHCTRILYEFSSYQNSRSVSLVDILQQEKFQFISLVYKFVSPLCHLKLYNFPIKRLQTYFSTINLNTSFILLSSVITNVNNSVRLYQKINLPPMKIDCNPCHKFDFPSTTEATLNLSENSANILYQIMTLEFQNYFVSEKKIVLQKSLQLFENDFINILQGRFIGTLYSTIDLYSSQSSTIDFPQFQPKEREQTNINQFPLSIPYRFPQKRYSNFIEDTLHSLFRTTLQNSQELSLFVTSYYISTDEDDEEHEFTISKRINKFLLENTEQIILESFQSSLISFDIYYCSKDLTEETIFFVMNSITSQFSRSLTSVFETSLFLNTSQIEDCLFYDINSIPIYVNDLIFEDFLDINTLFYSDFYASIKKETFLNLNNSIFNFQRKNNREDNLSLRYPYPSVNEAVVSLSDHSIVGFSFINNLIYHQTNEKKKILHHAIKYLLYEVDDIISSTFLKSVINSSINAATESYNLILYHPLPQKKLYEMPMIIYNQLDEIITESLLNSVNNDFFICLTGNFDQDFHEFDSTHKIHKTELDQQIFEHKFKRINRCLKEMIDENINHALNHHFPTFNLFIHDQSEPSD
ncbi:hypothetical protein TRFO_40212 [Tritrichomonas foetus]|uniref:Uncharacterized protein n=1 Tax=Tritrichomonas foetus TaxID=1144522 RepID=A0A1J4J5R6_9EUKA|nr:hypothetical protein TRFO_40212 [Tritrichomonas foetus]|eukprot:OHS93495.1 hypothetical protein TRFO_40212 [Tritrichomonas foetus]